MAEKFKNLVEVLEKSAAKYADRPLFGVKGPGGWSWLTYGEFSKRVDAFRTALAALGVARGDRIAIIADNRVEWAVACYATYGLGAAFVPMYQAQLPKEWHFILEDCGAKVVLCATGPVYDTVRGLAKDLPALRHVIGLDAPASDPSSYAALLAKGAGASLPTVQPGWDETAGFIYTSGTTGQPKGVILSHGNIASNLNALQEIFVFEPEDRSLAFLPWAHSFGQTCELHGLISMGCSTGINDDIPNLVANLAEVRPTVLFAVPRIFNRIYDGVNQQIAAKPPAIQSLFRSAIGTASRRAEGQSVGLVDRAKLALADKLIFGKIRAKFGGRLRYAISGSAALNRDVARFIDALGIMVYEGYGLTETSPIATANYPGNRKIGSVGKAIPGCTIKIDRAPGDASAHGEIVIYGPNVMQGYHNRPDENSKVMLEDGGFRSGDMGYLDDDGYLYITGRIKEQYKLENGKYVVPAPLEEELKLSPYIANVMLHGSNRPHNVALIVPDPLAVKKWAEEKGLVLSDVLDKSSELRELLTAELEKYSTNFKGYEKPKRFAVLAEDFTTDNGLLTPTLKLKRHNVFERYGTLIESLYK